MYGEEDQAHANETFRRAEALLISQSIPEVREVELKTKAEIEGKKQQLKLLVGNSYRCKQQLEISSASLTLVVLKSMHAHACRDLISGADQILEMAHCCDRVLANISSIQVGRMPKEHMRAQFRGVQSEAHSLPIIPSHELAQILHCLTCRSQSMVSIS